MYAPFGSIYSLYRIYAAGEVSCIWWSEVVCSALLGGRYSVDGEVHLRRGLRKRSCDKAASRHMLIQHPLNRLDEPLPWNTAQSRMRAAA